MKIVFYTSDLVAGGAERVMSILSNKLVSIGHEVSFIIVSPEINHVVFYPLDSRIRIIQHTHSVRLHNIISSWTLMSILRNDFKQERPDAVVCFFSRQTLYMKLSTIGLNSKVIYSLRSDPYSISLKNKIYDIISAVVSFKMVCQSQKAKEYYPALIRKKIVVIKNPLEIELLPSDNRPNTDKTIVAVGRLIPSKNYDMLLDAFAKVADDIGQYNLIIYGEGVLKEALQKKVHSLHLRDRVFFMGNVKNVLSKISNSSLFVMCSDYEGLPNALIEAMCLGLPCISTDYSPGGVSEIIVNNENGIIIGKGDVNDLAFQIKRLINNLDLRRSLSKKAVLLQEKVDSNTITEEWINCFRTHGKY